MSIRLGVIPWPGRLIVMGKRENIMLLLCLLVFLDTVL